LLSVRDSARLLVDRRIVRAWASQFPAAFRPVTVTPQESPMASVQVLPPRPAQVSVSHRPASMLFAGTGRAELLSAFQTARSPVSDQVSALRRARAELRRLGWESALVRLRATEWERPPDSGSRSAQLPASGSRLAIVQAMGSAKPSEEVQLRKMTLRRQLAREPVRSQHPSKALPPAARDWSVRRARHSSPLPASERQRSDSGPPSLRGLRSSR